MSDTHTHSHRKEYPEHEEAVQDRKLLSLRFLLLCLSSALGRSADAALYCRPSHQQASEAPSTSYFTGEQQAFVRHARSACIALSSFRESSVQDFLRREGHVSPHNAPGSTNR